MKSSVPRLLPLGLRKRLAVWIHNNSWIPRERRIWWSQVIVEDFAAVDVNAYHKFLWSNHMAYAKTYNADTRFGVENLNQTRLMFLDELTALLKENGIDPATGVDSVFDVGCSLGYLLHHVEMNLFPGATRLAGIDIDGHAIDEGQAHLDRMKSKVRVEQADMEDLADVLGGQHYDIFFCTGVLMYLEEDKAQAVVQHILDHTSMIAGFSGLADPANDNVNIERSGVRDEDESFIHNIDRMVTRAGGRVVRRRWEGDRLIDGNTVYFVFAVKDDPA